MEQRIQDTHIIRVDVKDPNNGYGLRTTVWTAGCQFHCPGCYNPETWKWNQGFPLTDKLIDTIIDQCKFDYIDGLSILGGDPLFPKSRFGVTELCKRFKQHYGSSKTIWLWTGYQFDEVCDLELWKYVDVVVDGKYIEQQRNITLTYCGSENQRVIRIVDGNCVGYIKDQYSDLIP